MEQATGSLLQLLSRADRAQNQPGLFSSEAVLEVLKLILAGSPLSDLNEKEAKARGIAYRLFKIPMTQVLRARTLSETRGFLKALVEVDGDRILGFTAFAVDGGEIMASVQMAMVAGLPYPAVRDAIWAHPTLVEGLTSLFSSAPLRSPRSDARSGTLSQIA